MYKIAILGSDIGYTKSPAVHAAVASALGIQIECAAVDIAFDDLAGTVNTLLEGCDGFFVTKPFKNDIARLIGSKAAGAVNVVRCRDREVANTDGIGFLRAMDGRFSDWRRRTHGALVIGAGGAAWAVSSALVSLGIKVYIINRTLLAAAKLCKAVGAELYASQSVELAVNCTSVADGDILKSLCILPSFEYAFDVVYTKDKTPFLSRCEQVGGKTLNGEDMLIYQAIAGDEFILGKSFGNTENILDTVKRSVFGDK